jgi:hypothetical protein
MPSADLLPSVPSNFILDAQWRWDGRHYARTARAWLSNLDAQRAEALKVLARAEGGDDPRIWFGRWRLFLMACEALFGFEDGREWGVAHYRFSNAARARRDEQRPRLEGEHVANGRKGVLATPPRQENRVLSKQRKLLVTMNQKL